MAKDKSKVLFEELYKNVDGMAISLAGRAKLSSWYVGYKYGEITYDGFKQILAEAKPKKGEIFYDLGSGTGKVVMLASLLGGFAKSTGIEIIKELHESSQKVLQDYRELVPKTENNNQDIKFILGDFKEINFSDADVIFINSTCMRYEFNLPFVRKLGSLKKGARIITTSGSIQTELFDIRSIGLIDFTWGKAEVFIHERI